MSTYSVNPFLTIIDAAEGIEFYKQAFSAVERYRISRPDGFIFCAEIQIGESRCLIRDCNLDEDFQKGSSMMRLYTEDVELVFSKAVELGATIILEISDHYWGDRSGIVEDPHGMHWCIASKIEEVSSEEIYHRFVTFVTHYSQVNSQ